MGAGAPEAQVLRRRGDEAVERAGHMKRELATMRFPGVQEVESEALEDDKSYAST